VNQRSNDVHVISKTDGVPKTDAQRAMSHYNLSSEAWEKLSEEQKRKLIDELPAAGTKRQTLTKSVEKRGDQWCVIHCHGEESGEIIKCFPTKPQADAMHAAIMANKGNTDVTKATKQPISQQSDRTKSALSAEAILAKHGFVNANRDVAKKLAIKKAIEDAKK